MKSIKEIYECYLTCVDVVIDTRKVIQDSMFVALKGANHDGNDFAKQALNLGARYILIDREDCFIDDRTILVEDCLSSLQSLARYHRDRLTFPVVGLTGSNGKTTTKELFHRVIQKKYNAKATLGNLNNHIGVPLTLLRFTSDTEFGIVEMGANHQQEIAFLSEITKPDLGYITNFGKAHLEGFGGVEGVVKGKSELYDFIKKSHGKLLVNLDDSVQNEKTEDFDRITFSFTNAQADIVFELQFKDNFVVLVHNGVTFKSNLIGKYNATNLAAAITLGTHYGVDLMDIKDAIETYYPDNNRSQLLVHGEHQIILDAYNANPSSMEVALQNFEAMQHSHKVMILGDMFELGEDSVSEHLRIASLATQLTKVKTFFIGDHFFKVSHEFGHSESYFFPDFSTFIQELENYSLPKSLILIKGSRGMALERVLDYLK